MGNNAMTEYKLLENELKAEDFIKLNDLALKVI